MIRTGYSLLRTDDVCPGDEGNMKMCLDSIVPYLVKLCPPGVRGRAGVLHAAEWIERLVWMLRKERKTIARLEKELAKAKERIGEGPPDGPIDERGRGYPRITTDGERHVG
jgi:hypothetical protein